MASLAAQPAVDFYSSVINRGQIPQEIRQHEPFRTSDRQVFRLMHRHFFAAGQHLILDQPPEIAVFPGAVRI
jgi:hypothetical protein